MNLDFEFNHDDISHYRDVPKHVIEFCYSLCGKVFDEDHISVYVSKPFGEHVFKYGSWIDFNIILKNSANITIEFDNKWKVSYMACPATIYLEITRLCKAYNMTTFS